MPDDKASLWQRFKRQFTPVAWLAMALSLCLASFLYLSYSDVGRLTQELDTANTSIAGLEKSQGELESMLNVDGRGYGFDETVVYINNSGKKYHKQFCQYVKSNSVTMFLTDAQRSGYSACSTCY